MRKLCIFIFILSFIFAAAQENDSTYTGKKVRFSGLYLCGGTFFTRSVQMKKDKLESSWNAFKDRPYNDYMESDYSASGFTGNTYYEAGASFYTNFGKSDSLFNRWQLNIGICYVSQSTISSFENYTYKRIDTLAPTSGAANYYMDHVEYNSVYVTHNTDLIGINVSEMFTPYHDRFLSATYGFGLNAMFGVNSNVMESTGTWTINYVTDNTYFDYNRERPNIQINSPVETTRKSYSSNAMYTLLSTYLAGGLNLRWIPGKGSFRVLLNPVLKAGVKSFNVSKGGSYFSSFALPELNIRIMFK